MLDLTSVRSRVAGSNPCVIEQIDLSDSLQEESVTGVQSRRVHVVHIVISTGLSVPCSVSVCSVPCLINKTAQNIKIAKEYFVKELNDQSLIYSQMTHT